MNNNKYPGICCGCGARVEAGEGIYQSGGNTWCSMPNRVSDHLSCATGHARRASAPKVSLEPNPEIVRVETERMAKFAEQDRIWASQGLCRCGRCGGAGGSSMWPGFTCYECGGRGTLVA